MLVVMHRDATPEDSERVIQAITDMGLEAHPIPGKNRMAIGVTGNKSMVDTGRVDGMSGVLEVIHVTKPYKLTSREMKPESTIIEVMGVRIGGDEPVMMAGPCGVESREQLMSTAECVKANGGHILRGGAYKPRTSPYSFQGMKEEGLKILAEARETYGMPIISEVVDVESFPIVEQYVDILQIGARNMQNFALLKRAGRSRRPVFLKRGISATINEFLLAAEYIMSEGNYNVILCERGIRTYSDYSRFTLDISSIPELRKLTHLPLIVDPSHASGKRDMVTPLALSGLTAGADGLMVEVHPKPEEALSDGPQSLTFDMFAHMMGDITAITNAIRERRSQLKA